MKSMTIKRVAIASLMAAVPAVGAIAVAAPAQAVPNDALQQVELPTAPGGCDTLFLPALNWAGVPYGGWGQSWAQWAQGGKGGFVCSRVLTFDASANDWYPR